jgi:hypothetical protein
MSEANEKPERSVLRADGKETIVVIESSLLEQLGQAAACEAGEVFRNDLRGGGSPDVRRRDGGQG